jgi:mono/diheme cytochrome c family protein
MPRSHFTCFGLWMVGQPRRVEGVGVPLRLTPIFSLLTALVPALGMVSVLALVLALLPTAAQAQTNIDQGKSPAQMFTEACAACHKSPRGLANGRNSSALAGFLVEHYTSGRQQAASLAAFVLGAGGDSGTAARVQARPDTGPEHAKVTPEEPKNRARATRQTTKPEEEAPATAKLQRPEEETKPETEPGAAPSANEEPGPAVAPGRGPAGQEGRAVTATRGRNNKRGPEPAPQPPERVTPAAVVAAPAPVEPPSQDASPAATTAPAPAPSAAISPAAPTEAQPGEAPVPRDNIPD